MNTAVNGIISIKVTLQEKKALYDYCQNKGVSASSYLYNLVEPTLSQLVALKRLQTGNNETHKEEIRLE